ncbi:MAG TPA: cation diffusion facilitator family transporter [Pseudomonadota bacterium]|nr:cation diffusion facilitator family transporter [Pseudomonadota bacterium]HNF99695.1 cation diffusion facilitator family transporter [Pseudomonadota bacterium]HNN54024.1 cation diffusion facilitator family transporter [Pseudomonadota bacterium]
MSANLQPSGDGSKSSDQQLARDLRSLKLTAALYIVIFLAKLGVYFATSVMALLAEAMHTLSDVIVVGFLLLALRWSADAPDEEHMFGHERGQSVAALVAATLFVSFTSIRLYEESLPRLFGMGHEVATPQRFDLAIGVIVFSMVLAALPILQMLLQKPSGAAAKAQLLELFNDELGLLAALVGTVMTKLGYPLADPIATALVATLIAWNGIGLFRENFDMVVGRSPGPQVLTAIAQAAAAVPGVLDAHDVRAERYGHGMVRCELHITIAGGTPIEEAHRMELEVRERVLAVEGLRQCHVHVDASPAVRHSIAKG